MKFSTVWLEFNISTEAAIRLGTEGAWEELE
jgi:hypothetical protein